VGELSDRLGRDAGLALGVVEGVALDLVTVGVEVEGGAADELVIRQPGVDDLAPDRVGQGDVAADIETQPDVGLLAVPDAAQEVVEEDRMRLSGIAAPEDDQVRLLDLTI